MENANGGCNQGKPFPINTQIREMFFATKLPQGISGRFRQWRIYAGYSEPVSCGKKAPEGAISFHIFSLSA